MANRFKPVFAGACAVALLSGLAACGNDDTAPATSDPHDISASEGDDTPEAEVRRDKQDIIDEYEEALAEARTTSGSGSPALWTLSDDDTTIHMFGTVHILRPELEWRTDEFDAAFESADKLVLEIDMESEEGMRAMAQDFQKKGLYQDGRKLSTELSSTDLEALNEALKPMGIPATSFDPMEPWMAAVTLSVLQLQSDGFNPDSGVEKTLIADAREDGKTFGYLETAAFQADIFDTLPEDVQEEFLYETALALPESSQMLDQIVDEWADGDVTGLGVLVANPDTGGGEGIYDALFLERNSNWVPQIEAMLDEPGTVFIAVGAGHLAGPDSVITMLRDEGYEVEGP
ncbi:TraB/GumN family protein [Henriciella sp. AS95]|uniref:TraB/GumN family protein n=1 Tax=Henriciella sp. AS95 TaxID=3135782 RepID=UPI0031737682